MHLLPEKKKEDMQVQCYVKRAPLDDEKEYIKNLFDKYGFFVWYDAVPMRFIMNVPADKDGQRMGKALNDLIVRLGIK